MEEKLKNNYCCGYCGADLQNTSKDDNVNICWFCGHPNIPEWVYKSIYNIRRINKND